MIGKQIKGKGFRGVLNYVLDPEKGRLIGGNMEGETPRDLSAEFAETRRLNPDLRRPVYHVSLSLSPGEKLTDHQWNQVADRYMREMGFGCSQYVVARHTDKDHDHIHIVGSRIGLDGKTVSDSRDYQRSEQAIREIERDFGLGRVTPSRETERRGITTGELRQALRTGEPSTRMQLQEVIDGAARHSRTMTDFARSLKGLGVEIVPNMSSTGRVTGLSFRFAGETMKGSDLGRAYSFGGLQKRGVEYDIERDREALSARAQKGPGQPEGREPMPAVREIRPGEILRGRIEGVIDGDGRKRVVVNTGAERVQAPIDSLGKLKQLVGKEVKVRSTGLRVRIEDPDRGPER